MMTVRVYVHPLQDLYHASKVYTGLLGLARLDRIRLRMVRSDEHGLDPLVVALGVDAGETDRRVAVDLSDRSNSFNRDLLGRCDVYFKRSFHRPDVDALPEDLKGRILPFGLNYGCRGHGVTARALRALGPGHPWHLLRMGLLEKERSRDYFNGLKQFLRLPAIEAYEMPPDEAAEPVVLFQTRLWEPGELSSAEQSEINEGRVALVRALRRAFGGRFWGGLVPTPYALRHFADAVTNRPTGRRAYVTQSRRAMVGVYTRGLHHSLAFKLPEYLASSKAVVADGLRNELPAPLREGVHYLGFRDPSECVEQCARLLDDPDRTASMRRANYRYYRAEVEPVAHLRRCLDRLREEGGPTQCRPPDLASCLRTSPLAVPSPSVPVPPTIPAH
jgi:hypothetical protein